jgi:hypothetical protein
VIKPALLISSQISATPKTGFNIMYLLRPDVDKEIISPVRMLALYRLLVSIQLDTHTLVSIVGIRTAG